MADRELDGRRVVVAGSGDEPEAAIEAELSAAGAHAARIRGADTVALREAMTRLGGLDLLVHVMPQTASVPFHDRSEADWDRAIAAGITAPLRLLRVAADRMSAGGGGSVVIVGTLDAAHAYRGRADASLAMGALVGLARSMAVELAPAGLRANVVLAGPLEVRAAGASAAQLEHVRLRSPSGRFVTPAEVAAAVRFVGGDRAGFMTGATVRVDAGWASLNQAPAGLRFP